MCLIWGREPGCAPGGAVTFSCLAKRKSPKRRRPYCARPLRCATGQPAMLGQGVRRRTHCALAALRSNNCGESVHEVRVSYGTRTHPLPCASRHAQKGTRNRTSTRAIASLGPVCAGASASRCAIQAERSDGPYGCWAVGLLGCWAVGLLGCWAVGLLGCWAVGLLGCWAVGLLGCHPPSVCAWGAQEAGWRGCAAGHTRASSTDSPRLSERSAAGAQ